MVRARLPGSKLTPEAPLSGSLCATGRRGAGEEDTMARHSHTGACEKAADREARAAMKAKLMRLTHGGREPLHAGVMWLGAQVGIGVLRANRIMEAMRADGEVAYEAKPGTLTEIRVTEKGRAT